MNKRFRYFLLSGILIAALLTALIFKGMFIFVSWSENRRDSRREEIKKIIVDRYGEIGYYLEGGSCAVIRKADNSLIRARIYSEQEVYEEILIPSASTTE